MKRSSMFLLIGLFLSIFFATSYGHKPIKAGNAFTTELLSDHSLTTTEPHFNNYGYGLIASGNIAHAYWQEGGNGSEGIDLFYRQLPDGSTIRLSDPTMSDGDVSTVWFDTAVAPDGTFHMIWLEDTNTAEGGDLFYWSAATGTLLLSDHSETEGYVQPAYNTLFLIMDIHGNPHTFWHEETGTGEGEDLFYWSHPTGTVLLTDRSQTEGNDVEFGPNFLLPDNNGTAHVTWAEVGNDGTTPVYFYWNPSLSAPTILPDIKGIKVVGNAAHIFWYSGYEGPIQYWNSATASETTIQASPESTTFYIAKFALFVDSQNTIHLFWGEPGTSICLSHWDTANQRTEAVATGENCEPYSSLAMDNDDNFHAVITDIPDGNPGMRFRYWNSNLASLIPIETLDSSVNYINLSVFDENKPAHLIWKETIDSFPPDHNFYHWDPAGQTAVNLSQSTGPNTPISDWQLEMNQVGDLHMLWSERMSSTGTDQTLYWNSVTNATENLFAKLDISSITYNSSGSDPMSMFFSANEAPYFIWHGIPIDGSEGFYLWDSTQDEIHLTGESEPCSDIGDLFSNDSDIFGNIYLAWQDDTTYTNYLWSKVSGQVDLSLTSTEETFCDPPIVKVNDNGDVFILWIETSDVSGEGFDVYGGWIESSNNSTYLPFIMR